MGIGKFLAFAATLGLFLAATAVGQPPFGPGGPKGPKGKKGGKGGSERLIDDLKLSGQQREQARAALRAYDDKVRQATAEARRELVERMKDVLTADDLAAFKADLDQVPLLPAVVLGPRGVPADDLIGRLMDFDKNKDGKVTKDELPERMHYLIEQGDTNGDGALDREEIRRLAARSERPPPPPGAKGGGPKGGGPKGGFPKGRPDGE